MSDSERKFEWVLEKMIDLTHGLLVPIALSTILEHDGIEKVRKFLLEHGSQEVKDTLKKATNFHYSIWEMPGDDFMELH